MNTVNEERAKFGVYHNALDHISRNVENDKSTLTETQIRDLDIPKEMTSLPIIRYFFKPPKQC
ncbi:flagellin [Oceanobacillus halotolerans]|uniref:flagellin n=1 Tax=Oceanobacillus halotolerans TaxID=2663380 RepID=UPI00384F0287